MADGDKIRIVRVRPVKEPDVAFIGDTLKAGQEVVGGQLEQVPLPPVVAFTNLMLMCNEDGLALNLPLNRFGIVGTFFFTKHDGKGNNISLSDEDLDKLRKALNEPGIK